MPLKTSLAVQNMILNADLHLPLTNPVLIFSLVLFIILSAPIILTKLKIPHIIELILACTIIGPYDIT